MSSSLEIERTENIVIASLNRPEKLNALNKEIFEELASLLDILETDKTVRAFILTGKGEKAFCVGADLKERMGMNEKDVLLRFEFVHDLYNRLERLPVPVIAAINGPALGGGLELALCCDLRIAAEQSILGLPETSLAIIPGNGGTQRLPRLVGIGKALEMILLARRLSASEALHIGLVNEVVPRGQSLAQAMAWAQKLREHGPIALRQAKAAVRMGSERPLDEGLKLETESYRACLYSKDRIEGLKAFSEKRKPNYTGD